MEGRESESSGGGITPVVLEDYRTQARASIPSEVFTYINSGAGDEITSQANRRDLDGLAMQPLCLRDVSEPKLAMDVLGGRALDLDPRLPARMGPLEPTADRVPD